MDKASAPSPASENEAGKSTTPPASAKQGARVQSVGRAVKILLTVAQSERGLKSIDIVRQTGLPKQATYHLVHTLVATGMLTRGENNAYVLGLTAGTIGEAFRRQLSPPQRLSGLVRRIAEETGETAHAVGWWDGEIVNLSTRRGHNTIAAAEVEQGNFRDAHARASGKLILAFAPEDVREQYLSTHPLTRRTEHTIVSLEALKRDLETAREQKYATDLEEFTPGVCCLAVPVDGGISPYALTISSPTERFHKNFDEYLATMQNIVASTGNAG
ncbi:IclR family transcriptional regulator [Hyphococcus luteus]|uniref:IclR family transcriptional regulator n=1 Tax=Hyphococcus luteus TaxID=2058213 RepID=A0A2S7KAR9_9PROT|nr:IclR family transcriptional regulator [Marinicaulis flavus]PQA89595.1 IclR family transcriptional regulator [Marinicaulis flavus]